MKEFLKFDELTREELEKYYLLLRAKYADLDEENQMLKQEVLNATELASQSREMAENYQNMFSQLFNVIIERYDADFKIEDLFKTFDV